MKVFKKILIVAGEASGDLHAAKLVQDVHKSDPSVHFFGMGGKKMQEAGVDIIVNSDDMAVIGLIDVIFKLPKILLVMQKLRRALISDKPDLVILIDYPGFNLRFAKMAKNVGCKVLYYIAPKLWASRPKRIQALRKCVNKLAVIFPFEVEYFRQRGVHTEFVGNPLSDVTHTTLSPAEARLEFGVQLNERVVGLFPGSRKAEIARMLPAILESAAKIKAVEPNVKFILPVAPSLELEFLEPFLVKAKVPVKVVQSRIYDLMQICTAAIAVSGTITLQLALMQVPMIIVYKVFPEWFNFKWIVKVPDIGLCNIVACKRVVKELWQREVTAENISVEILKIMENSAYHDKIQNDLQKIAGELSVNNRQDLTAIISKMLT